MSRMSHASYVVRPPVLTSFPPRPSSVADDAPQDTRDPSSGSPFSHTKLVAHILTQKSCVANQNKMCPKALLRRILPMVLPLVCQGHLMTILQVFQCIAVGRIQIQLSLDCPKNPTRWSFNYFPRISFFFS
jgi:hypothetical protein